jgi:tripartite-type tricarboxylate transporter receptor subunit TctC
MRPRRQPVSFWARCTRASPDYRYRAATDSLTEFQRGKIDYGALDPAFALNQQRSGLLRILAHSSGAAIEAVRDIPTMAQAGVAGIDLTSWWAVHAPIDTPRPIVNQVNAWFRDILSAPDTADFLHMLGGDPFISTPDEGQALFIREEKAWKEYVRLAKIEPQ